MKVRLLAMVGLSLFMTGIVFAQSNSTRVGRYLVEKNGPVRAQSNPLQTTFQLTFPNSVISLHDAINYLLSNTGYNLVSFRYQSSNVRDLLKQRLPLSDRQFGPMTVEQGLLALAGSTEQLLIDPAHRLISFKLKQPYQQLYLNAEKPNWSTQ